MKQINTQTVLSVNEGIATVEKMCWGCGEFKLWQIPLDDIDGNNGVKAEWFEAKMCEECVKKFCS